MAILEAAACGLPVMMTPQCNFPELTAAGGAIEMQPEMASCENGLRQMLSLSNAQRKGMGSCGQGLIQESYTWAAIAARMAAVYAWVLQQGPKPECVSLN
jgi:poly(glycerol-phosphate) alpha-glucosyltransferase